MKTLKDLFSNMKYAFYHCKQYIRGIEAVFEGIKA